ncbi:MAG: DUF6787 family protein [Chitinophagaceae bacterium]
MLKKLQDKWKVSGWRLVLILVTFAVGGSLTGYIGKKIMGFTGIEAAGIYIPVYIIIVTLIWPFMVIVVSIFTGQFVFFKAYLKKMGRRMRGKGKKQGNREQGTRNDESKEVGNRESGVRSREMSNAQQTMFNAQGHTESGKQEIANQKRIAMLTCLFYKKQKLILLY